MGHSSELFIQIREAEQNDKSKHNNQHTDSLQGILESKGLRNPSAENLHRENSKFRGIGGSQGGKMV